MWMLACVGPFQQTFEYERAIVDQLLSVGEHMIEHNKAVGKQY